VERCWNADRSVKYRETNKYVPQPKFYYKNLTSSGLGLKLDSCCPVDRVARPKLRPASRLTSSLLLHTQHFVVRCIRPQLFKFSLQNLSFSLRIHTLLNYNNNNNNNNNRLVRRDSRRHTDNNFTFSTPCITIQLLQFEQKDADGFVEVTRRHNTPAATGPSQSTVAWWAETCSRWSVVMLWLPWNCVHFLVRTVTIGQNYVQN
jgi:hypothetical protein